MSITLSMVALLAMTPEPVRIELAEAVLRLDDLVSGGGDTIVSRLPGDREEITLDAEARIRLLRNRFPARQWVLQHEGPVTFVWTNETESRQAPCFVTRHEIAEGAPILQTDVQSVVCDDGTASTPDLAYDPNRGAPMARRAIPAQTYLGALRPGTEAGVSGGDQVTFRTAIPPVTIERRAIALQPGRQGRSIFAKTEDGEVIVAPLAPSAPEKSR